MPRPKKKQAKTHERRHGQGSVQQVGARWRAWRAPEERPDGSRYRASRMFDTEADAATWARGVVLPDVLTVGDWLDRWLGLRWQRLQPNTQATYRGLVAACAPLAGQPLTTPDEDDWQALANELLTRWSREHVKVWKSIIGSALRSAVPRYLSVNPLALVKLPRPHERPVKAWRHDEVTRLLVACRGQLHEQWLILSLATGGRINEMLALERADISLSERTVTISKSVVETTGLIGPTKSGRIRVVDLPAEIIPGLAAHLARLPANVTYVFGTRDNRRRVSHTYRAWLARMCKRAGVTPLTPHALRHTAASLALDAGVPIQDVARALGHSTPTTTANVYSHFLGQGQRRVATAIGAALELGVSGGKVSDLHGDLHVSGGLTR